MEAKEGVKFDETIEVEVRDKTGRLKQHAITKNGETILNELFPPEVQP